LRAVPQGRDGSRLVGHVKRAALKTPPVGPGSGLFLPGLFPAAGGNFFTSHDEAHMAKHQEFPFRVFMEDGTIHLLKRVGISCVAAEHPDAVRWERADKTQPPALIEIDNDA
jgi:hypothetical protein